MHAGCRLLWKLVHCMAMRNAAWLLLHLTVKAQHLLQDTGSWNLGGSMLTALSVPRIWWNVQPGGLRHLTSSFPVVVTIIIECTSVYIGLFSASKTMKKHLLTMHQECLQVQFLQQRVSTEEHFLGLCCRNVARCPSFGFAHVNDTQHHTFDGWVIHANGRGEGCW